MSSVKVTFNGESQAHYAKLKPRKEGSYLTSSPRERSSTVNVNGDRKNISGQVLRFESEQDDLSKCRTRKRTSVVRPHQVDRMYYMSGTPLRLEARYRVEEEELQRLRELSRSRKKASYYGRGLRSDEEDLDESPKQPPPSCLGDAGNSPVEGASSNSEPPAVDRVRTNSEITEVNDANKAHDLDSVSEGDLTGRKPDSQQSQEQDAESESPLEDEVAQQLGNLSIHGEMSPQPQTQEQDLETQSDINPEQEQNTQLDDADSGVDNNSVTEDKTGENTSI